jgi:Uma2 family endonuclease
MDAVLENIVQSPRLKQYVEELTSYLKEEENRRMHFYETITEQQKAEFINGQMVLQSPVTLKHNAVNGRLFRLLSTYVAINNLGFVGIEKVLIRLSRNDFEPDICFFTKEKAAQFTDKTMFFPVPDFVVEVLSKSTEKIDRGIKLEDYALHKIPEYWIIDAENESVEQWLLQAETSTYTLNVKINEGMLHSFTIKGFDIDVQALFNDEVCNQQQQKLV